MLKKILPIVFLLVGSGVGVGAGIMLRPAPELAEDLKVEGNTEDQKNAIVAPEPYGPNNPAPEMDYVKLNNQFVVPIVKDHAVVALVVLALSLEVPENTSDAVFRREPKLRDSFLQVLFDHANMGGFDGAFTEASNLDALRTGLREAGQKEMGADIIKDVLIIEIARQDY